MEQIERKCKICLEVKYLDKFHSQGKGRYKHICKECDNILNKEKRLEYNRKYRLKHPEKKKEWQQNSNKKRKEKIQSDPLYHDRVKYLKRESGYKNKVTTMYNNAKKRALKYNVPFEIAKEDIIIPNRCPILDIPFIIGRGKDYLYTPTLDRIEPEKGYTKDNIAVISMLANSMKNSASKEELITFSKNIINYINKDIVQPIEKSIELEDKEPLG